MRSRHVLCLGRAGFHRMHYTEWGDEENPACLVCVHGLTRNGRDFDALAEELSSTHRVICPDVVGRGQSDWLPQPSEYGLPQYLLDMAVLVSRLDVDQVDWLGTSMGGLIGITLAAQPRSPIRRLVVNDVGPSVSREGLARIKSYVGAAPSFASLDELERHLRKIHAPLGPLEDAQWRQLAQHGARRLEDGTYALHYDPAIAAPFEASLEPPDLWPLWDAIACPVTVLRGRDSDVLTEDCAREMTRRGPRARLIEFEGIGHAPALVNEEQIAAVRRTLAAPMRA